MIVLSRPFRNGSGHLGDKIISHVHETDFTSLESKEKIYLRRTLQDNVRRGDTKLLMIPFEMSVLLATVLPQRLMTQISE
ncbi:hypothetical protein TNCV_3152461 [Trichonephila clavipes]|nr:hypothetical protein TNCV_3152461 [Trichonephila clavipes]